LLLDAVLTGAKGLNLWSSFRVPPPQRRARVYRALVERGLASSVSGSLLPTAQPFLYTLSATATDGIALSSIEEALVEEIERVRRDAVTPSELDKAKSQLQAQLVFDHDSITNIAHQIGYFETIASADVFTGLAPRINLVSLDQVADAARALFAPSNRTVGWFEPLRVAGS
jgi:zinc protease